MIALSSRHLLLAMLVVAVLVGPSRALAGQRVVFTDGRYLDVEEAWEDEAGKYVYYIYKGRQIILQRSDVARIEGKRPEHIETIVGPRPTPSPSVQQPAANQAGPQTHTITGSITLISSSLATYGSRCSGSGGYSDVKAGSQVTVTDASGRVIGVGALEEGELSRGVVCRFAFSVSGLPEVDFYGVEVGHRRQLNYSLAEMKRRDWTVELVLSR